MVHGDLLENKTELMLNGDIMFKMHKKVATVLSPPPELNKNIDGGAIKQEDPNAPQLPSAYEATQAALIM